MATLALGDDVARRTSVEANPHVFQALKHHPHLYASSCDIPFQRNLSNYAPRTPYRRRKGEVKTVQHWGQRRLLMGEIELLTQYAAPGSVIVYAGAAPGTHTPILVDMFPECEFILVDPAPFSQALVDFSGQNVSLINEPFTDDLAELIHTRALSVPALQRAGSVDIIFISDIRTCDIQNTNATGEKGPLHNDEIESSVADDMQKQWDWVRILKPRVSMVKMRLPWSPGKTIYMQGEIRLPIWGPTTTTETRLIVTDPSGMRTKVYDNTKYEEQLFHFNTVARVARYPHNVKAAGIDHCYDCTAECHTLLQYMERFPQRAFWLINFDPESAHAPLYGQDGEASGLALRAVGAMIEVISDRLGNRNLSDFNGNQAPARVNPMPTRSKKNDQRQNTAVRVNPMPTRSKKMIKGKTQLCA